MGDNRDDEREESAISYTFEDGSADLGDLSAAWVARVDEMNPELELRSVTFQVMLDDVDGEDLPTLDLPNPEEE